MNSNPLLVTFEDIDPVVSYTPFSQGNPSQGWQTVFPSNTFIPAIGNSQQGIGNSLHRTTRAGAGFEFTFYGTSVQLFGTAGNTTYSVSLDGGPAKAFTEQSGLLAELYGLPAARHTVHLTVDVPSPALLFDRAEFNAGIDRAWSNSTVLVKDQWSFAGQWFDLTVQPAVDTRQQVRVTEVRDSTAWLQFEGSAISIIGNLMTDHGDYQVNLDGESTIFNGTAHGLVQGSLLFFKAGLDPSVRHQVTLRNMEGKYFDVQKAVIVSTDPSGAPINNGASGVSSEPGGSHTSDIPISPSQSASSSSPTAAIVGGAIGGCAAATFAVLLFLLFWMRRRRHNNSSPSEHHMLEPKPFFVPPSPPGQHHHYAQIQAPGTRVWGAEYPSGFDAPPSVVPSRTDSVPGTAAPYGQDDPPRLDEREMQRVLAYVTRRIESGGAGLPTTSGGTGTVPTYRH